jgi:drug/metabolite transporter (DMT)-like permease
MRRSGLLSLVALAIIWGTSFLWIKIGLRGLSPVQITALRLTLGALVLVGYVRARGGRLPREAALWAHLFTAAFFANVVPYLLFAYGEQQVDSAIAGVINATTPLWTILLATAVGLEKRPTARKLVGLVLGFAGALIIFEPWGSRSEVMSTGGLACLVAAASYGISYVYMARFLARRGLGAIVLSAAQLVAASVLAWAALPVVGWPRPELRLDALVAVLILGVLGTGVAYVLNYRLITAEGASSASIVTYLAPVVAVLAGALALRETIPLSVLAGMGVVLVGVALARSDRSSQALTAPDSSA